MNTDVYLCRSSKYISVILNFLSSNCTDGTDEHTHSEGHGIRRTSYLAPLMKYFSHLNTAVQLLQQYNGQQPFGSFMKQFFSQHSKYGSKDRKNISQLCYAFFRVGKALPQLAIEERVLTGLFLCSHAPNELLQHLKPEWNEKAHVSLAEKIHLLTATGTPLTLNEIFPWKDELSDGI